MNCEEITNSYFTNLECDKEKQSKIPGKKSKQTKNELKNLKNLSPYPGACLEPEFFGSLSKTLL